MAREENVITLQNNSDIPQHVFADGQRWSLYAKQVVPYPEDIAKVFLSERSKFVTVYKAVQIPKIDGFSDVWMANLTGNPFLKPTISVHRKVRGEWVDIEKENPLIIPRVVTEWISFGQVIQTAASGDLDESLNFPKRRIEIPPFTRTLVPAPVADRLLERDGARTDGWSGMVGLCRAPSVFEPNETWELDDIRLYAGLLDAETFSKILDPANKLGIHSQSSYKTVNTLAEAKHKLLDMLFFRLNDDRYAYPSREEFTALKDSIKAKMKANAATTPQPNL